MTQVQKHVCEWHTVYESASVVLFLQICAKACQIWQHK